MKIAFTTLGCPDWEWSKIIDEAKAMGYDGIEVRGVMGEMDLTKIEPFLPENQEATKRQLAEKGLEIICLGSSVFFHSPEHFDAKIEEGKAAIDLASTMNVPFVRVFGDNFIENRTREETKSDIARGLQILGEYAEDKSVHVLIETHGDMSADDIVDIMKQTSSKAVGVLWDSYHTYTFERSDSMESAYAKLGQYIKHTHIKDSSVKDGQRQYCLTGEGDIAIQECIEVLKKNGYTGYLSFEWEKKWHPEIEEPELAFPSFIKYVKGLI